MGKTINISDELASDALVVAEQKQRSVADQIEHWAQLGKIIEPYLSESKAADLARQESRRSIAEIITSVDTLEGKRRTKEYLESQPYPHFEAAVDQPGYLVRIEADGTRTVGRFENRVFVAKTN